MKALRALSKASEQGRGYALFDMTRGILNFLSGLVIRHLQRLQKKLAKPME